MNSIDKLIQLAAVRGNLDLRCSFQGNWALEHDQEPAGVARYHIVLAGVCQAVRPDGTAITLRAGDILVFVDGEAHRLHSQGHQGVAVKPQVSHGGLIPLHRIGSEAGELDILCGRFLYQRESLLLGALPKCLKVSSDYPQTTDQLSALVGLLRAEADGNQIGARFLVDTLSSALFAMVVRSYLQHQPPATGALALLSDKRLSRAWQAMLDDPAFEWTIESLAEHASMSRATFMRSFVKVAGESPWVLLTRVRMELAFRLLSETQLGLTDIACQVGYQSQAAFGKKFKDFYGTAPGRIRRAGS
ncbi:MULTISPECIES: AraC family transcriptional regulator [Pseudomonas]|jgi:AraC family transcriptional activator of mtrCDE|uniref:AraC family transcriptional regulator n=1 Tax=Pseudomonas TaxID=286 RepID=UPI00193DA5B0|nr:AraC family transcriptional regulator [Pseudomonas arcuscaelestis]MBM3114166.1 AraC family transcriptional regulator [Pseudomonas arcuscaelestis]